MFINDKVYEIIHLKKNTLNRAVIYPFCVISKLGWYWNKLELKNATEMNFCNNESISSITFLGIIDLQNKLNKL